MDFDLHAYITVDAINLYQSLYHVYLLYVQNVQCVAMGPSDSSS